MKAEDPEIEAVVTALAKLAGEPDADFDARVMGRYADINRYGYGLVDAIADVLRGED